MNLLSNVHERVLNLSDMESNEDQMELGRQSFMRQRLYDPKYWSLSDSCFLMQKSRLNLILTKPEIQLKSSL